MLLITYRDVLYAFVSVEVLIGCRSGTGGRLWGWKSEYTPYEKLDYTTAYSVYNLLLFQMSAVYA